MIRIAILGDIGSGKSYVAKQFGYPVFNADTEVAKLYRKSRKCYRKLKKALPNYIFSFPVKKKELSEAIIKNNYNIKKINKIIHPEVRLRMNEFIKKNRHKKAVILDIPLLLEGKINRKKDILLFVDARKKDINRKLKVRNNFKTASVQKNVKRLKNKIFKNERSST